MFEALIAALIVGMLILAAWLPPMTILWCGVVLGSLGALIGVPAGLVYHGQLWRALRAGGHPTTGMWLRPHHMHHFLDEPTQARIKITFAIGAAGFVATLLGAVGVVTGVVRLLT
ncbi:MAG: hypothetical protein KC457_08665 [Myxococcales bacterium]|nr:hypothetical protein [Myxococcales bacterium]